MPYFNGTQHGINTVNGFIQPVPTTKSYCEDCAPQNLEGWDSEAPAGREHWNTDFRWVGGWIGEVCCACNKNI